MTHRLRVAALIAGMAAAIVAAVPLTQCIGAALEGWPRPACIDPDNPAFDPNGPQPPECYIPGDW